MGNELIRYADTLDDIQRTANILLHSGYFDATGNERQQLAQMAVKIMAGKEMGYTPFAAVQGIHVIKGKPTLSANLMAAAVKAHPRYDYRVREMSAKVCKIEFFETVDGKRESLGVSEFTEADAKAAGTQNMQKFARNMLFARAMSNGVRWFCPDVFAGNAVYTPDELGADVDEEGNAVGTPDTFRVIEQPQQPQQETEAADELPATLNDVDELDQGAGADHSADDGSETASISDKMLRKLHAVGRDHYGDKWDDKRHDIIAAITGGRTSSASHITDDEAQRIIDGINERIAKAVATVTGKATKQAA